MSKILKLYLVVHVFLQSMIENHRSIFLWVYSKLTISVARVTYYEKINWKYVILMNITKCKGYKMKSLNWKLSHLIIYVSRLYAIHCRIDNYSRNIGLMLFSDRMLSYSWSRTNWKTYGFHFKNDNRKQYHLYRTSLTVIIGNCAMKPAKGLLSSPSLNWSFLCISSLIQTIFSS